MKTKLGHGMRKKQDF